MEEAVCCAFLVICGINLETAGVCMTIAGVDHFATAMSAAFFTRLLTQCLPQAALALHFAMEKGIDGHGMAIVGLSVSLAGMITLYGAFKCFSSMHRRFRHKTS